VSNAESAKQSSLVLTVRSASIYILVHRQLFDRSASKPASKQVSSLMLLVEQQEGHPACKSILVH